MTQSSPLPELGSVPTRIRTGLSMLHPSEQRVAQVFLDRPEWTIEASAQEVADAAGTSRATVVRTAQRLGFTGYPQLRVLLARDVGSARPPRRSHARNDPAGLVRDYVSEVAGSIEDLLGSLSDERVRVAVGLLDTARTVLVVGTGLSEPIALEAAMRLNAIGIPVQAPADRVLRGTRARQLDAGDVCLAISGSGSTRDTLQAARAAAAAGAAVIALTGAGLSPLGDLAQVHLVAPAEPGTFSDGITRTPRLPLAILLNALVHALITGNPERAQAAQTRLLEVIGDAFAQEPM